MRRRKRKSGSGKKSGQKRHAYKRILERYGIELTKEDYGDIVRDIQNGRYRIHSKQSNRVSVFIVKVRDVRMPAVYDRKRKTIATFLPPEFMAEDQKEEKDAAPCQDTERLQPGVDGGGPGHEVRQDGAPDRGDHPAGDQAQNETEAINE